MSSSTNAVRPVKRNSILTKLLVISIGSFMVFFSIMVAIMAQHIDDIHSSSSEHLDTLVESSDDNAREMNTSAVDSVGDAVNDMSLELLDALSESIAVRTELMLMGMEAKLVSHRFTIGVCAVDFPNSQRFETHMEELIAAGGLYPLRDFAGTPLDYNVSSIDSAFYFDLNGTLVEAAGSENVEDGIQGNFSSQTYFSELRSFFNNSAPDDIFYYDPFMYPDTTYFEPNEASKDDIVVPMNADPFTVIRPDNLEALQQQTRDEQKDLETWVLPDTGNFDPDQLGLIMATAVEYEGNVIGYAGFSLTTASLYRFARELGYEERTVGKEGYAYTFNSLGILAQHPLQYHIGSDSSWHAWVMVMQENITNGNYSGNFQYDWRGTFKMSSYRYMPDQEITMVVTSPLSDYFEPVDNLELKLLGIINNGSNNIEKEKVNTQDDLDDTVNGSLFSIVLLYVLFMLVFSGVLFVLMSRLVEPLEVLTESAEQVGQGDLDSPLDRLDSMDTSCGNEICILGDTFRTMLRNLRKTSEELRDLNRDLEEKVAQRTGELEEANDRLRNHEMELMESNEKLTESNELKSEFVGILSHDIGSPLSVLKGTLETARRGVFGEMNDKLSARTDKMIRQVDRIDRLRRDTLDITRMDLGKMELETESFDFADLVNDAVEDMKPLAEAKQQRIAITMDGTIPVTADRSRLRQVVDNFLSNAIRYTDEEGAIVVTAAVDNDETNAGTLHLSIRDSGRGIPAKDIENVFRRFFRTGPKVEGSTGLGLAIVRGIVEVHGGRAWCESEGPGMGSTFHFTIPKDGPVHNDGGKPTEENVQANDESAQQNENDTVPAEESEKNNLSRSADTVIRE